MIDPNRNTSPDVLVRLRDESYERMQSQLLVAIETLLTEFQMTWDDLAVKLGCDRSGGGSLVRSAMTDLTPDALNDIAHVFSMEPYIIFRPRQPWTKS